MLHSHRKPIPAGVGRGLQTRCALRPVVQVSSTLTGFRQVLPHSNAVARPTTMTKGTQNRTELPSTLARKAGSATTS